VGGGGESVYLEDFGVFPVGRGGAGLGGEREAGEEGGKDERMEFHVWEMILELTFSRNTEALNIL